MTYGISILFVNLIIQKAMRKSNFQSAASKGNHWGGLSSSAGASWKSVSSSLESNPSQNDPQSLSEVLRRSPRRNVPHSAVSSAQKSAAVALLQEDEEDEDEDEEEAEDEDEAEGEENESVDDEAISIDEGLNIGTGADESYDEIGGIVELTFDARAPKKRQDKFASMLYDLVCILAFNDVVTCGRKMSSKDQHTAAVANLNDVLDNLQNCAYYKNRLFDFMNLGHNRNAWPKWFLNDTVSLIHRYNILILTFRHKTICKFIVFRLRN